MPKVYHLGDLACQIANLNDAGAFLEQLPCRTNSINQ